MNAHVLPRLIITVITLVLATTGLTLTPTHAADTARWSDTAARANVLVQDCHGASVLSGFSPTLAFGLDFEITTSYRIDRHYSLITHYTGVNHPVVERQIVSVAGIVANSETDRSLAYDGYFTRTTNYADGDVTITDLSLHLIPSNEEDVTVTVERDDSGVFETPEAMLLAFAPRGLHMSLCSYFAGLEIA